MVSVLCSLSLFFSAARLFFLPVPTYIKCNKYATKSVLLIRLKRESRKPQSINKKIVDMKTDTLLPFIGNLNEF